MPIKIRATLALVDGSAGDLVTLVFFVLRLGGFGEALTEFELFLNSPRPCFRLISFRRASILSRGSFAMHQISTVRLQK